MQYMLKAVSKLRAAPEISQGIVLGQATIADEPKFGRWVAIADTLTSML